MSTARPIRATRPMITQPSAPKPVASVSRGEKEVSAQRSVRSAPQASARTPSSFQVVDGVNRDDAAGAPFAVFEGPGVTVLMTDAPMDVQLLKTKRPGWLLEPSGPEIVAPVEE